MRQAGKAIEKPFSPTRPDPTRGSADIYIYIYTWMGGWLRAG